ncbi:MAG: phosphate ABC transporter permease subunit PstC [Planctomycetia bacterium]|nr:phosphate ABC transporter permease subunit PstC [Planctomycetia bacterium]
MNDNNFQRICCAAACLAPLLLAGMVLLLGTGSWDAWRTFGWEFLVRGTWDPAREQFGAGNAMLGTLLTTGIAMLLAVPPAFLTAFYLNNAAEWVRRPLSLGLDLLAAIPSVIYGMWGLFVLAPVVQKYVQPFLLSLPGLSRLPIWGTDRNGFGIFTAGLVLALMILPYISAVMRDVFRMTPPLLVEAARGIGCTRWETARDMVLRYGFRGMLGGVLLGLGRALGETMAVLFVVGNVMRTPGGLFDGGTTIAATLANHFAEADGMLRSVLFALGLVLLALTFAVQIPAYFYRSR